jgi:hypothetical protein
VATEVDVISKSLSTLGNYRVERTQYVAAQGPADGISGSLLLALTLRETWGRNIEGGAKWDEAQGKWVALDPNNPDDAHRMDVGAFQINRGFHKDQLQKMPAVKVGTWTPVVPGKTPYDPGFVPRFEEQLQFAIKELRDAVSYARTNDVKGEDRVRFAIAAHNAGKAGALKGYREGDVDKYTAFGNYSADILAKRTEVNHWLNEHPHWKV